MKRPTENGHTRTLPSMAELTLAQAMDVAIEHQRAGRLAEAEAIYHRVLAVDPGQAEAWHLLGTLALQVGQWEMAEGLIRRAITIRGEWAEACYHLGLALQGKDQFEQAIAAHRRAIALNPEMPDAHYNLAVCLQAAGFRDRAIAAYGQALALKREDPFALVNLAIALQSAGQLDGAIAALRRAVAVKPDFADAFVQLGKAVRERGMPEDMIAAFERATALRPDDADACGHLAAAMWEAGRADEALVAQRKAVALKPDVPDAHWVLAGMLLATGDFAQGWRELEWRWRRKALPWPRRRFTQPLWAGGDLAGKTILLHAEQSCGDTVQFIRYLPLVLRQGAKAVVECQPALRRLFRENWSFEQWVAPGEPLPSFDGYCPLLSLPRLMGTLPSTIPDDVPYVRVAAEWTECWRQKVSGVSRALKVGLAWAGSPSEINDRKRSLSLSQMAALAGVPDAHFFSLQKGQAAAQAHSPPADMVITDFGDEVADFADTAALICQLDLVVCVDTAVAHLAGALGKPVWVLLPHVPHWRWGLRGDQTPWYPTMRLFRQKVRGDWEGVVGRVAEELRQLMVKPRCKAQAGVPKYDEGERDSA